MQAASSRPVDELNLVEMAPLVEVDNDNDPVPENLPTAPNTGTFDIEEEWGHNGLCHRRKASVTNMQARLSLPSELSPTTLQVFELFFFKDFIQETLLSLINSRIEEGQEVTYGEFLLFLGLWLLMATIEGPTRKQFFTTKTIDAFDGAPYRLNVYMSGNRFENILKAMTYTDDEPPPYQDKFHPVRLMINEWNKNMSLVFTPSYISCLDESMSFWSSKYTCPGFMFVPRKPWPFGNEYHTICCALSGVMYQLEIVEGKDRPREMGKPEYESMGGPTIGLLLRLTKCIWGTGRIIVLDSEFCVLQAIIELAKFGIYAAALIKKRRYWPKYVKGEAIKKHFEDKNVGDVDAIAGKLDNIPFHYYAMKEPDYVMMLMSTYGTLERSGGIKARIVDGNRVTFQYPELIKITTHTATQWMIIIAEDKHR